jgi:cell division protease FtsH
MECCSEHPIPVLEPDVTFDDVYGSGMKKSELRRYITWCVKLSFDRPDLFPLGHDRDAQILLCGPPTADVFHIAMAIAKEVNARFIPASCKRSESENVDVPFMGGPERIRAIFARAKANAPCVIFLGDIDAITWDEMDPSKGDWNKRFYLLDELNHRQDGVIVVASTNRPKLLDIYIYGKFMKRIEIKPFIVIDQVIDCDYSFR